MLAMKSYNWGRGGDTLGVSEPPCPFKYSNPKACVDCFENLIITPKAIRVMI